jgi:putative ABC transport system permease protein
MLAYQIRLAWISLKRNPVLSLLIVLGIGLGIAVAMTFVTARHVMAKDPLPHKSDALHYVRLDFWNPDRPWDDDDPSLPPNQVTWKDAMNLLASDIPVRHTAAYKAELTIHPERREQKPFRVVGRLCTADFFTMFEPPFRFGSGWDRRADAGPDPVVVLDHEMNLKLFGGADSVGRKVEIEDRPFEVVGVLAPWRPLPKYYDTMNDALEVPEAMYVPLQFGRVFELYSDGNTSGWSSGGATFEEFLQSENIFLQMWVELDGERGREDYATFLRGYADAQEAAGRPARQENIRLDPLMEWLQLEQVVPEEVDALILIAMMFLVICSVNLIGILLGKFLARAPEMGVRRALGASRSWVFGQHVLECQLIGVLGGLLGVGLSWVALRLIDRLFRDAFEMKPDLTLLGIGIVLALASALIAGVYPAWRICRIQPSVYLKTQ